MDEEGLILQIKDLNLDKRYFAEKNSDIAVCIIWREILFSQSRYAQIFVKTLCLIHLYVQYLMYSVHYIHTKYNLYVQ